jgi:hypothetical protein
VSLRGTNASLVGMETALQHLVAILGDAVRTDSVSCEKYRFDWSRDPTAGVPIAVVRPRDARRWRRRFNGRPSTAYLWFRGVRAAASPVEPRPFPAASCSVWSG